MEKRGMVNQVFVYIFVIIVIALIFLFGFNMVKKLNNLNEQTVFLTFKTDFNEHVDNLYYKNVGSTMVFASDSRNKPLRLPEEVEEVCFENGKVSLNPNYSIFNSDKLTVLSSICIPVVNNQISFRLENVVVNQETYVQISEI